MATVTIKINEKTNFGKALLALLKVGIAEKKIELINIPNKTTVKAIEELEEGKGKTAKSAKDLFKQLGI